MINTGLGQVFIILPLIRTVTQYKSLAIYLLLSINYILNEIIHFSFSSMVKFLESP